MHSKDFYTDVFKQYYGWGKVLDFMACLSQSIGDQNWCPLQCFNAMLWRLPVI